MAPARTPRSFIPWLTAAVIALIAYGSLYPFNFKLDAQDDLLGALRQLSWARAGRGDRISNVLLYLPLGFCLYLWLNERLRRGPSLTIATLLGTLLSLAIEVAQVYVSRRVPSLTDLVLNSGGTFLGAVGGVGWAALTHLMHLPARAEKQTRDPGAALLIGLWLAWRFAPFVPQFDLGKLKAALRPLFNPSFDFITVLIFLTCWLVVNQAVAALVSRPRRLETLLLLMATVLIGRLVMANQTFVPAELLALLLLLPMVVLMHRLRPRPRRATLVLAVVALLVIEELAPFDFSPQVAQFDFWPFLVFAETGWDLAAIDWVQLFGKLFLYGALLWVVREWGASTDFAFGVMLTVATSVELLQIWLPAEHASITDPLLALLIGLIFRSLYRRRRPGGLEGATGNLSLRER
ncbi:VanZ family protein [Steroidobacter sp. S1-65]|uniref:VanZ family protein n=1 Tax=Steroidobacter gossypii TaxID=2805490 RepID=A0ABS1WT58_9GAMM|nr:VanZ family protein [Steroidobacter gossypii]MBM0104150.1 VanZ family protein [Steroidobacter gossypii]